MNESLCPKCGAYWECDCDVQPLFIVVDEVGEISEEAWAFLKQRVDMKNKRLVPAHPPHPTSRLDSQYDGQSTLYDVPVVVDD